MTKYYFKVWLPNLNRYTIKEYSSLPEAQRWKEHFQRRFKQVGMIYKED